LLGLVAADQRFFRRLLYRLAERLAGQRRWDDYGIPLFLDAAEPRRLTHAGGRPFALIDEKTVRDNLAACWRVFMSRSEPVLWLRYIRGWLRAYEDGPDDERLLAILVEAADEEADALGRLYGLAWELRDGAGALLIAMIDAAQGFELEETA
jgi:hypothetical protein